MTDLIEETHNNLEKYNIRTLADVRLAPERLVDFSAGMKKELDVLKSFLSEKMYRHPHIMQLAEQARTIIETLFEKYRIDPTRLHGKYKLRLADEPPETIIRDFIAGMTDRYAYKIYDQLK